MFERLKCRLFGHEWVSMSNGGRFCLRCDLMEGP